MQSNHQDAMQKRSPAQHREQELCDAKRDLCIENENTTQKSECQNAKESFCHATMQRTATWSAMMQNKECHNAEREIAMMLKERAFATQKRA